MFHVKQGSGNSAFDVIVVGGGHAGIEASLATARMGFSTLLITMSKGAIGRMSCNPAIGGTAKGHLVREIDALGGEMGKIADATGIQFRMLNKSKGPAVWSPRCQNDRELYSAEARRRLESQQNLEILESSIVDILADSRNGQGGYRLRGAVLPDGRKIRCRSLILCAGTFLRGILHTGERNGAGGRFGEPASYGITENLEKLGFQSGRLKTGTPPRIDLKSIDLGKTEEQHSDRPPKPFSFQNQAITNKLIPMYLTHTSGATHRILEKGFDRSPMFTGRIKGIGPRYCPSIEDKIVRFPDRESHQIFLEPEGYTTDVVYVNGFSTSLPEEIQYEALRTVPGLENVKMLRPGYAVEYDFFPPHQLKPWFETKLVEGLFFAGQICGTSGYEEAAAQGLMAGINAGLKLRGEEPFVLKRSEAYIGVLLDDLINKSTNEPYRMFTSRAEYRLLLRQDNADRRLMPYGEHLGLIPDDVAKRLRLKETLIDRGKAFLRESSVEPAEVNEYLERKGTARISTRENAEQLIRRPEVELDEFLQIESLRAHPFVKELYNSDGANLVEEVVEQIEIEVKYDGYFTRQEEQVERFEKYEEMKIPESFDYSTVRALSSEGREKLSKVRPVSIGQASRISGVTPADVSVLLVHLKR